MGSRGFLSAFALLVLLGTIQAQYAINTIITEDSVLINKDLRISFQTTTASPNVQIQSVDTPSSFPSPYTFVSATSVSGCIGGGNCVQTFSIVLRTSGCTTIDGPFSFNVEVCDVSSTCTPQPQPISFTLNERDVCGGSTYTLDANITSFGAYADASWQSTRNNYYINDNVYLPFLVTYEDLSITSVTFDTITCTSGSTSVILYQAGDNTAAGDAVDLTTKPVATQLGAGVESAFASLSFTISREANSPFANIPAGLTTYEFDVLFNVGYKNAKRAVEEGGQLRSQTSITINGANIISKTRSVSEQKEADASAANSVRVGMSMLALSGLFVLFAKFMY